MPSESDETVVPLYEEGVSVAKRRIATGRWRIATATRQDEVQVDEPLTQETVEVERTAVNKLVDRMPSVREEGDTLIVPVVEETLVLERRLVLKEEVRIRRVRKTERHQERVKIRKQEATITKLPVDAETAADGSAARQETRK
jgi:uncharacterized protein (TIGR02271 family)